MGTAMVTLSERGVYSLPESHVWTCCQNSGRFLGRRSKFRTLESNSKFSAHSSLFGNLRGGLLGVVALNLTVYLAVIHLLNKQNVAVVAGISSVIEEGSCLAMGSIAQKMPS
jgi:hypothetical protein